MDSVLAVAVGVVRVVAAVVVLAVVVTVVVDADVVVGVVCRGRAVLVVTGCKKISALVASEKELKDYTHLTRSDQLQGNFPVRIQRHSQPHHRRAQE